jgi:hypothetical protein
MQVRDPIAVREAKLRELSQLPRGTVIELIEHAHGVDTAQGYRVHLKPGQVLMLVQATDEYALLRDTRLNLIRIDHHNMMRIKEHDPEPKNNYRPLKGPERKMEFDDDSY